MIHRFVTLLSLFLLPLLGTAQGLTFCLDHTKEGGALAPDSTFELDQFGQEIDFLFHYQDIPPASKLYFFIDKEVEGGHLEYDTKTVVTEAGQDWVALSYRFERSGRYRVMVMDAGKVEVARSALKVSVLRDVGGPSYYQDAELAFCNRVKDGEPDTRLDRVMLGRERQREVQVLLRHYRPLRFSRLVVDVWKDAEEGEEPTYVETMEFQVESHWLFTQFSYPFKETGSYRFRAYSEDEVWIATGKITVAR